MTAFKNRKSKYLDHDSVSDFMLPYRVFLLTCWQDEDAATDPKMWRFRLEEPRNGKQHGFINLEALTAFLQESLKESDGDGQDGNETINGIRASFADTNQGKIRSG